MFVENLTKSDFLEYVSKDKEILKDFWNREISIDDIFDFNVEKGRVSFSIGRVDFVFTDFDAFNNYMFRGYNGTHNKEWISFMYSKFGEDYKYAFYKFRTLEKRRFLRRVGEQFDKETAKFENLFMTENEFGE